MDTLEQTGTLHTIAQVAIALIGFTGIVIAFGERAKFNWTPEERLRFYTLVAPSLTAFFCSFVPILAFEYFADEERTWRFSNFVLGLMHGANFAGFLINRPKAKITLGQKLNSIGACVTIAAHFLAGLGVLPWFALIYIFGLLQQIFIAIHNFLLLFQPKAS